jgi:type I restriction enzyme S subunit
MAGERRYIAASDFCASVRDGTHDSPKPVEFGRRLVTSRHLTTGRLDLSQAYLISEADYQAINKRSKVDQWDVLISMIGTVGEPCLIKDEPDFAIKNIGLFKTKSESDGKWLYYYLRSKEAQQSILAYSRGTTQQYIPLGALRDFPILVTDDPAEQRAIAHVLGTLDDLIELNRETNAILEEMARALFKSWFVDFDPVRAKLEGRPPAGMDAATAALFPDHFQDSELGQIPMGWEVATIKDCCTTIQNGGTPRRDELRFWQNGDIPWLTSGEVRQAIVTMPENHITAAGLSESSAKWVSALSTVVALYGATAGQVSLAASDLTTNQAVCALIPKQHFAYLNYLWMREARGELENKAVGSAQQNISKGIVEETRVILAPMPVVEKFARIIAPLFDTWISNLYESRDLATLRDTLLPKLLSGEITIPVAEELIAAAS